jgi:hypothetical protein
MENEVFNAMKCYHAPTSVVGVQALRLLEKKRPPGSTPGGRFALYRH